MIDLSLGLNVLIAVLLIVTIGYCWTLMRRLGAMRDHQAEMRQVIEHFAQAIAKAEVGVAKLKGAGEAFRRQLDERTAEVDKSLRERIETARTLSDELAVMTRSADKLADRLEATIEKGRGQAAAEPPAKAAPKAAKAPSFAIGDRAQDAKSSGDKSREAAPAGDDDEDEWEEDSSLLDELNVRSEVERELLQALRQAK